MNEALKTAAEMLQTTPEDLARYPESVQQDMIDAAAKNAFDDLHAIWEDAYLNEEMQEVSRVSGVSMQSLLDMPNAAKVELTYLLAQNPNDSTALNRRITEFLSTASIPDIAVLLKKPVQELRALPLNKQKELCGAMDMLYGTVPEDELIAELTGILNGDAS